MKAAAALQLQRLDASAPITSFEFAEAVAAKVANLYGNTDTIITDRLPAEPPTLDGHALAYAVQRRGTGDEGGGILRADLDLVLLGSSRIVSAPPKDEIEQVFESSMWIVEVVRDAPEQWGSIWKSVVHLKVKRGWTPTPYVGSKASAKFIENRVPIAGDLLVADMLQSELAYTAERFGGRLTGFSPTVSGKTVEQLDADVVRQVVTLGFNFDVKDVDRNTAVAVACKGLVGALVPGVGVVESADDALTDTGRTVTIALRRRTTSAE